MKRLALLALMFVFCQALAQTGTYLLVHHRPEGEAAGQTVFDITQDDNGLMYFAVQRGILRFDSRTWDLLPTGGAVYDLHIDNNTLFAIGWNGAGKISLQNPAGWRFEKLPGVPETPLFRVAGKNGCLFLGNDRFVFEYNNGAFRPIAETNAGWMALLEADDSYYISSAEEKTYQLRPDGPVPVSLPALQNEALLFAETHHNLTLFGTAQGRLYLLESGKYLRSIKLADSAYARASVVISACWVAPDLVALGTLRGGVLFVNPLTGRTEQIINYAAGLPDNEVLALATDKNRSVWVAHRYGITRIMPFLPLRSFAHYPGLQGIPLCAQRLNGVLYVGTSLGLYRLDRQDRYEELVYYAEVPVSAKATQQPAGAVRPREKSGLFSFLKKRKTSPQPETSGPDDQTPSYAITYKREKRTLRILRSSEYLFRKVEGIDARISKLQIWENKLLANGLAGVWLIKDGRAQLLLDEPVRHLLMSITTARFIICMKIRIKRLRPLPIR